MYWTAGTGAHFVRGAIRTKWAALGWENSDLGYPTTDEACTNGGCVSTFTGGGIYYTATTGAHAVTGAMAAAWTARGAQTGSLGYPLADMKTSGTVLTQRFQGGTLTVDTSTGTVTAP